MKKTLLFKTIALSLFMLFSIGILNAQTLFISEVADPGDQYKGRFVELYNATGEEIDFDASTWYMSRQSNGGTTWGDILLTGKIASGSTYVIGYTDFESIHGFAPDLASSEISGNGDDAFFLYSGSDHTTGTLVDIYGEVDTDGSGLDWEYENTRAVRNSDVSTANTIWTLSEWTIDATADFADCTPGAHTVDLVAADLFFSEYVEGSVNGNNRAIEIFNGTGADVDLSAYTVKQSHSSTGWGVDGIAYVLPLTGTLADGDVFVIANESADAAVIAAADLTFAYADTQGAKIPFFTGDDALALFKSDVLIDVIGIELEADGDGPWAVAGVADATMNHTLVRKGTVTQGNTDWAVAAGTDADDSEWVVLATDVVDNLGSHTFGEAPVETPYAITFNVDMSLVAGFDSSSDVVYISGFPSWDEPGSNAALAMTDTDGDMTYTIVLEMDIPGGDIAYKFFLNAGWDGGEWTGGDDRAATITETTTLNHIFGNQGEPIILGLPFIQNFDYTTANASVALAGWTNANVETGGIANWIGKEFSSDKYVQMSSYGSASTGADQVWLITPGITMTNTTEELSFDVNVGYYTHDGLSVMISTDFDQTVDGISTATWTDVTADFTIPSEPTGAYGDFATAGHLDVSSYTGTMYVAFIYEGDKTASETTTYQIDNVVVAEAGTVGFDDVLVSELNIYPNPSNGKFYLQMSDAFVANAKIEVFNVVGMKVFETLSNDFKTEIDLSDMKQGVYYVRVDDGQNIVTQKVMKQ